LNEKNHMIFSPQILMWRQYSISPSFYWADFWIISLPQKLQPQTVNFRTKKLLLIKLTPGVNIINVQWAAFAWADPANAKKTDNLTVFFALLGPELKKINRGDVLDVFLLISNLVT